MRRWMRMIRASAEIRAEDARISPACNRRTSGEADEQRRPRAVDDRVKTRVRTGRSEQMLERRAPGAGWRS